MSLHAYLDESVDDEAGIFVLSGYIAEKESWDLFSEEWSSVVSQAMPSETGHPSFKMSKFHRDSRLKSYMPRLHKIINDHVMASITLSFFIEQYDYVSTRIRLGEDPSRLILFTPTKFEFAYCALLIAFHQLRQERPDLLPPSEPVHFHFDDHTAKKQFLNRYDDWLTEVDASQQKLYGEKPTFEDDKVVTPLQAADFRAGWMRKLLLRHPQNELLATDIPCTHKDAKAISHFHYMMSPESLQANFASAAKRQWPDQEVILLPLDAVPGEPPIEEEPLGRKWLRAIGKSLTLVRNRRAS